MRTPCSEPSEEISTCPPERRELFAGRHRFSAWQSPSQVAYHPYSVLMLYTGGRARIEVRGRFEVGEGDLVVIPAGEGHRILEAQQAEGWGLRVPPTLLSGAGRASLREPFARVRRGGAAAARLPAERRPVLEALLRELSERTCGERPKHERAIEALLTLVLIEVAEAQSELPSGAEPLVSAALSFIEQHCIERISLRDVADAVRRSPAHLTTAVRRATGHSVGAWITAGRMAEARRRLLLSEDRVEQIGEQVGYADPTHFIRSFRKSHGQTPAAWRRQQRRPAGS